MADNTGSRELADDQIEVVWGYDELLVRCTVCDVMRSFGRESFSLAQVGADFRSKHVHNEEETW